MFAAFHLPNFALQAVLRHEPELSGTPAALLEEDSAKALVAQVNQAATRAGIAPGMTSPQAKARAARIEFRLRSALQEEAAQEILLEAVYQSAAFIESTAPGLCIADLRGLPLLKNNTPAEALETWARHVRERLSGFNLTARAGIAPTPDLAAHAARAGTGLVSSPEAFWKTVPVESLGADPATLEILRQWGIATAAEFLTLGQSKIAERLGPAGVKLFESARADKIRPLNLTAPKEIYEEGFEFEQPVETLEPLLFKLRRLLEQLSRRVETRALIMDELFLALKLESGESHDRFLKIPAPSRDTEVLFRIAHHYLETVRTSAPVSALALRARPCRQESEQFQLFETAVRDPNRFYETVGRLNALLGPDRVGIPVPRDSHRPDDFTLVPVSSSDISATAASGPKLKLELQIRPVARGPLLRRFRPPQPASVRLREGQPVFLRAAAIKSAVIASRGPSRRSGNWWENFWAREEWDVQTRDGALYRIFLEGSQWFVEGALD